MPRKQRFKPSRKPKPNNEEVGKSNTERMPEIERTEIHPDDVEAGSIERVNGSPEERQD